MTTRLDLDLAVRRVQDFILKLPPSPIVATAGGADLLLTDLIVVLDTARHLKSLMPRARCGAPVACRNGDGYCLLDLGHSGICQ